MDTKNYHTIPDDLEKSALILIKKELDQIATIIQNVKHLNEDGGENLLHNMLYIAGIPRKYYNAFIKGNINKLL